MNILVVYTPKKNDECLAHYFGYIVGPELREKGIGEVHTLPLVVIEEVRYNMERIRKTVEEKHIDLVVAAGFNAFLALALPSNVKKLAVHPVLDPLADSDLKLSTRCVFSDEDYKYMCQLRRVVNGYITLERKRNTFAIFIPCYGRANQHEIFERKYGHVSIKNWADYTGRKAEGKGYKINANGKLVPNREEAGEDKWKDFHNAIDVNLKNILSSFFPDIKIDL